VTLPAPRGFEWRSAGPEAAALALFVLLAVQPLILLARDWWTNPDAGHGLLLAPLALWLMWRTGLIAAPRPRPVGGTVLLASGVTLRYFSALAAEQFTMKLSVLVLAAGLVVFTQGWSQVRRWWLPFLLLLLSIPLPTIVLNGLSIPLQLRASRWGAALIEWRHIPVRNDGNVILIPGQRLFVAEACSGLRSLTALLSLGILIGGLWLRTVPARVLLLIAALPVAMAVNAVRIFLTAFLMLYVSPDAGRGFMHLSEGWLLFLVAFGILGGLAWLVRGVERRLATGAAHD
jgi:exosortase